MRKIQTFNVGTFEKNKLIFHTKYLNTKMSISIKVYGFHLIHRYNFFFGYSSTERIRQEKRNLD